MQKTLDLVRDFARDEEGVTAIEYGLLAALIAVAIIVGAGLVGSNLNTMFTNISGYLTATAKG